MSLQLRLCDKPPLKPRAFWSAGSATCRKERSRRSCDDHLSAGHVTKSVNRIPRRLALSADHQPELLGQFLGPKRFFDDIQIIRQPVLKT